MILKLKTNEGGFSLLELLIYMGLLAGIMLVIANIFTIFSLNSGNSGAKTEVQQNLQFAMQNIINGIKYQQDISSTTINANGDVLDLKSTSGDILLRFDAQNGKLRKILGSPGANCAASGDCKIDCAVQDPDCLPLELIGSKVTLAPSLLPDNPIFKKIGNTIQIKLDISYNNNGNKDLIYQQTAQSTVSPR